MCLLPALVALPGLPRVCSNGAMLCLQTAHTSRWNPLVSQLGEAATGFVQGQGS